VIIVFPLIYLYTALNYLALLTSTMAVPMSSFFTYVNIFEPFCGIKAAWGIKPKAETPK